MSRDKRDAKPKTEPERRGLTRRGVLAGTAAVGSAAALGLLRRSPAVPTPRRKPRWIGHM